MVLVNADKDQAAQNKYMADSGMKNPALPHDRKNSSALMKKYGAIGYPTLILLDQEGEVITNVIPFNPPIPVADGKMQRDKAEGTLEELIKSNLPEKEAS